MTGPSTRAGVLVLVAAPAVALAAAVVVLLGLAAAGRHPWWPPFDGSVAEAAISRDLGAIQRAVWRGEAARGRQTVRGAAMRRNNDLELTPFEAAIQQGRLSVFELLEANGILPAADERGELLCLARSASATDIEAWLERLPGPSSPVDCAGVSVPWR
ncbi:MAG: hypothetical protein AB7O67_04165 [Vicinamibacterales bacterium]